MVLVELASVEEAIDAVATLLAMLSQMKSKGSKPLKYRKAQAPYDDHDSYGYGGPSPCSLLPSRGESRSAGRGKPQKR